jgi:hypothetical protein
LREVSKMCKTCGCGFMPPKKSRKELEEEEEICEECGRPLDECECEEEEEEENY